MTVAPCDGGAVIELWLYVGRTDGRWGGAMWRRVDRAELAVPFHVALNRAHDLINQTGVSDA